VGSSALAHAKSGATILNSKGGEWHGLKLLVTPRSDGAMELLAKAADGSTCDELTMAEITDVLAARFDVTATSSSGGSAVVHYTQKTLAELHPALCILGSSNIGKKINKSQGKYIGKAKGKAKGKAIGLYSQQRIRQS
jgi:hypothetical protein